MPVNVLGWFICAVGSWFCAAIAGAMNPVWIILLLGGAGAIAGGMVKQKLVHPAADGVTLIVLFLTSAFDINGLLAGILLVVYVWFGMFLEMVLQKRSAWKSLAAMAFSAVLVLLYMPGTGSLLYELWEEDKEFPMHAGLALPHAGERIQLERGAVAWLLKPVRETPRAGVLFMHGADHAGSHQKAAYMLQRALLQQGYLVMSLDHPGFGESPYPEEGQPVEAWDPTPLVVSAYERMNVMLPEDAPRIAVGHSMGTKDVFRLLIDNVDLDVAMIMGGAVLDDPDRDDHWYKRFHRDRHMDWFLPREDWKAVQQRYYSGKNLVMTLEAEHTPLFVLYFGVDWPNVIAQRDALWEAIPGEKHQVTLPGTTHYFNTFDIEPRLLRTVLPGRLILADTRVIEDMQSLFEGALEAGAADFSVSTH